MDIEELFVIDVDTAFNALVGLPWTHKMLCYRLHIACIKHPLRGGQGTKHVDNSLFVVAEAYYADVSFY